MGLFGKKKADKNNVPELPELPSLPELPKSGESSLPDLPERDSVSSLPSMPNSNFGEKMNQNTIKEAVSDHGNMENFNPPRPRAVEAPPATIDANDPKQEYHPGMAITRPRTLEISDWDHEPKKSSKKSEPLFIKLDKFENTLSTFNEIKLRVSEIDNLLSNIREIKNKEEQELIQWEQEIETIKARLDQIDKEIFNNL